MLLAALAVGLVGLAFVIFDDSNLRPLLWIFVLLMFQGTLEMAFGVTSIVSRGLAEAAIVFLFAKAAYGKWIRDGEPLRTIGLPWALLLLAVTLFSFLLNGSGTIPLLLFVRHVFIFYIFFIALLNMEWSRETGERINRALVIMFLLQLPAALEKVFRRGIEEGGGIGTMSVQGGELSTMMPLFVIAFLTAMYLYRPRARYVFLIVAYIAFGVLSSKRGLVFLVPFVLLFTFFAFRIQESRRPTSERRGLSWSTSRVLMVFFLVTAVTVYGAVRTLTSLNPESRIGGAFDLRFLWHVITQYETWVFQAGMSFGRIATTLRTIGLLGDAGTLGALFGFGPGVLVESQYLVEGTMFQQYLRFGIVAGRTGFVWFGIQLGYAGVAALVLLYASIYRRSLAAYSRVTERKDRILALGLIAASFVFLVDFAVYGSSTLLLGVLTPVYFYLTAYFLTHVAASSAQLQAAAAARGPALVTAGAGYGIPDAGQARI